MSKNRMFNTKFWSDGFIVDELNPHDRYLFMYLMLNEKTNLCGIYELPIRTIANETGIDKEEVSRMIKRLEPKIYYKGGWVVLTNALKHQNYKNSKIAKGLQNELCKAPAELIELLKIPNDFDMSFSCEVDKKTMSHDESSMTPDKYNIIQSNSIKSKPTVTTVSKNKSVDKSNDDNRTTGLNKLSGRTYAEVSAVYDDLKAKDLVNDKYKAWYCSAFFKLGRERVMILASQAKADGKDPQKLFSHLISKESGIKEKQKLTQKQ